MQEMPMNLRRLVSLTTLLVMVLLTVMACSHRAGWGAGPGHGLRTSLPRIDGSGNGGSLQADDAHAKSRDFSVFRRRSLRIDADR
jgi:hypothetical protein